MKNIILFISFLFLFTFNCIGQNVNKENKILKQLIEVKNQTITFYASDIIRYKGILKNRNIVIEDLNKNIVDLKQVIKIKDNVISTYKKDSLLYAKIITNSDSVISNNNKIITNMKTESNIKLKRKNRKIFYLLGTNIITISIICIIL
jgi:hypothetical protein